MREPKSYSVSLYLRGEGAPQSSQMALFWEVGSQDKKMLWLLRNLG